jgi:hypothetical protein
MVSVWSGGAVKTKHLAKMLLIPGKVGTYRRTLTLCMVCHFSSNCESFFDLLTEPPIRLSFDPRSAGSLVAGHFLVCTWQVAQADCTGWLVPLPSSIRPPLRLSGLSLCPSVPLFLRRPLPRDICNSNNYSLVPQSLHHIRMWLDDILCCSSFGQTPVVWRSPASKQGTPPRGKAESLGSQNELPKLAWLSRIRNDPLGQRWRSSWAQASLFPSQPASSIVSTRVALSTALCSVARRQPAGTWRMQQNHTHAGADFFLPLHSSYPQLPRK